MKDSRIFERFKIDDMGKSFYDTKRVVAASDVWAENKAAQSFMKMDDRMKDRLLQEMYSLETKLFGGDLSWDVALRSRSNSKIRKQYEEAKDHYNKLREQVGFQSVGDWDWQAFSIEKLEIPTSKDVPYLAAVQDLFPNGK